MSPDALTHSNLEVSFAMTATMQHTEPTDAEIIGAALASSRPPATHTTIEVPSIDELQRVFANALLAASSDQNRPPLCAIQVEITDGLVEIITTDSYRLMHQTPAWTANGPDGHWLIDRDGLAPLLAVCKSIKGRDRDAPCVIDLPIERPTAGAFARVRGIVVSDLRITDWSFPNWRQLVPADDKLTGQIPDGIPFTPKYLTDTAKYRAPGAKAGEHTVKLRTQDHLKPAMFTLSAEAWYLLMPVRCS